MSDAVGLMSKQEYLASIRALERVRDWPSAELPNLERIQPSRCVP